jgi:poly-gamma-glutamate synthesis protein (capsule biosynthesis protein)
MASLRVGILFFFITFFLAACTEGPEEATETRPATNEAPSLAVEVTPELATTQPVTRPGEPTVNMPATVLPTAVPTPTPLRLSADPAVPSFIRAAGQMLAAENPSLFSWVDGEAEVRITVAGGTLLASWVYAVAAPFPTFADEISLADLQTAWQEGRLYLDEDTTAVLTSLWGEAAVNGPMVTADDLVMMLWQAQTDYGNPVLTVLPFEQLTPQLKVLAVESVSPVAADFDPAVYSLTVPIGLAGEQQAVAAVQAAWNGPLTNREDSRITQVAMTGPAGMRRAVADRMEKYGLTYPAEVTGPVLQAVDIAHMSNENAFASDCPLPDPFDSDNVCNRDE